MTDDNRQAVERFWQALARREFDAAAKELHSEFAEDWPQSGERIVGVYNWLVMVRAHPAFPKITVREHVGEGSVWVTQARFEYPAGSGATSFEVCAVQRLRDGRITHVTEYFGAPFEPASWRAKFVQRS
jgi:limonene-1,2-epoxide hydrolase